MRYHVDLRLEVEADSPELAALTAQSAIATFETPMRVLHTDVVAVVATLQRREPEDGVS